MSDAVRPGQIYWNAETQAYAIVWDVWGLEARVTLLHKRERMPHNRRTRVWKNGPPPGWDLYYTAPPWRKK